MEQTVIQLLLNKGEVSITDKATGETIQNKIQLPDGCIGFMLVFESKKAASEYDPDAGLCEIELGKRRG